MDGIHIIILKGPKNIIIYCEEHIVPYIENIPQLSVNFIESNLGIYSIFLEDEVENTKSPSVNESHD